MKERLSYIDIAKGIGILLMIAGHIWGGISQAYIYSFHMPLFFILSGITLNENQKIDKIIYKSLWPYFTFSGLWCFYTICIQVIRKEIILQNYADGILSTFMLWGIGNLWFIPCMVLAKIFFQLFSKLNKWCPILVSIGAIWIIFNFYPNGNTYNSLDTVFLKSLVALLFLSLGHLIIKPVLDKIKEYKMVLLGVIIGFEILHLILFKLNGFKTVDLNTILLYNPILYIGQAVLGSVVVIGISIIINRFKLLEFIGKNSVIFLASNNFNIIVSIIKNNLNGLSPVIVNITAFVGMVLIESILALFITRFCPFFITCPTKSRLFQSSKINN